ncbi:MAG: hypothetical protein NTW21_17790 [Verrucomicrobia bacterium]|nr:hypothetical protein [Verrucomicrobiota bacterium]
MRIRPSAMRSRTNAISRSCGIVSKNLMGHASVETTMIYLHLMRRPGAGGPSPLDIP